MEHVSSIHCEGGYTGTLSPYSSRYNSFEDRAPVDEI